MKTYIDDIENISQFVKEDKYGVPRLGDPLSHAIMKMEQIGMCKITEDNWQEFWYRCNLLFEIRGVGGVTANPPVEEGKEVEHRSITKDEVKKLIGLRVTGVDQINRQEFHQYIYGILEWKNADKNIFQI